MRLIKHFLFILFFVVCCGEIIQTHRKFLYFEKLDGAVYVIPKPEFSSDNWLSGKYQDSAMTYFEEQANVHPFCVRLRNQIGYSLFDEIKVSKVELGKDQNLFGGGYIPAYLGMDFNGDAVAIEKVTKLKYVQEELKKRNVDIVFVIAPGKPSLQPEYIPAKYDVSKKSRSNYDAYAEQLIKQNINHIDFRKYFLKIKNKVKHPLHTRCGVHWSGYGGTIAADSLIKYMEKLRNIDMPDYYTNGGTETTVPRYTDADIGHAMDLIWDIPCYPMYYPNIVFKKDTTKTRPDVLIIGDSFVWTFVSFYEYVSHEFGDNTEYWYYNNEVKLSKRPNSENQHVSLLNLKEQTLHRDFILLVFNDVNLNNCGYGFIEKMYTLLQEENKKKN